MHTLLYLFLALTVQIKGLWTGQGEGRRGRKGEGSESMGVLNKGKGGKLWGTLATDGVEGWRNFGQFSVQLTPQQIHAADLSGLMCQPLCFNAYTLFTDY